MAEPLVMIPTGFGLNCEEETETAFRMAGAKRVQLVHFSDVIDGRVDISDAQILALIGGFAFADHHGAGLVQAVIYQERVGERARKFVDNGGYAIGICNGFQAMAKMGFVPDLAGDHKTQQMSLDRNSRGEFYDGWVTLRINPDSPCVFTKDSIMYIDLPVRHGEGKIVTASKEVLDEILAKNLDVAYYVDPYTGEQTEKFPYNPNGSNPAIAGVCSPSGRIFGLMPHPEAFLYECLHPDYDEENLGGIAERRNMRLSGARGCVEEADRMLTTLEEGGGVQMFRNVLEAARKD
jgi:phosphoribosylformylglycinamidine (FGAM) synthase-like amidotransferase family enzyme